VVFPHVRCMCETETGGGGKEGEAKKVSH